MFGRKCAVRGVLASVAVFGSLIASPTATARADEGPLGCVVGTAALPFIAKTISKGKISPGSLAMAVLTAFSGYECPKLVNNWTKGQSGTLAVKTPSGETVSQTLQPSQFATNLQPVIGLSRSSACSGWTWPAHNKMCLNGQLDPIYP
jgi:hypothetical protein